jgi:acetylornithine deacetylase/succinyl-diaminopimelate desuccinylase-like protein
VEAPADEFSAARAMAHIEAIADEPRPVGSAQHAEARAYLLEQLASLGWRTEVQESVGMFDFGQDGTQSISAVANIIATKSGSDPTGTVLLTAHYDTVPGSPGAADDGIGVGAILETARALNTAGVIRNDVMILLTDAEERGLHGAEAFVRECVATLGPARRPTRAPRRSSRRCRTTPTSRRWLGPVCTATTPGSWRTAPTTTAPSTIRPT